MATNVTRNTPPAEFIEAMRAARKETPVFLTETEKDLVRTILRHRAYTFEDAAKFGTAEVIKELAAKFK